MYLVTRVRTANPARFREALAWALKTRDHVNANSDIEVSAHVSMFGRPVGTFQWATLVEGRGAWAAATSKLMNDSRYLDLMAEGGELFLGSAHDTLRQIIHLNGMAESDPRPAFSQGWAAQIREFKFDAAIEWGVAITDHVAALTGARLAFLVDNYGDFGTVTWIAGLDSAEQADAMNDMMINDAEWKKRLAAAAEFFIDGRTTVWLNRTL